MFSLSHNSTPYKTIHISNLHSILWLSFILLFTAACSSTDSNQDPELYQLGKFTDGNYTVTAYSYRPLAVGFHEIYLDVTQNGESMEGLHIHFNTMMHMEGHSHASPYGEPGHHRDDQHSLFEAWAIFTMPGGSMGDWELEITVHDIEHSGLEITGSIAVEVDDSNRVHTFVGQDDNRYILTWIEPKEPETGMNDLVVSLHTPASMMDYPAVINADIAFEPWMPSMDHGSSNNVNPEHQGSGFYHGEVNFNMTGDWELRCEISRSGEVIGTPVIELEF